LFSSSDYRAFTAFPPGKMPMICDTVYCTLRLHGVKFSKQPAPLLQMFPRSPGNGKFSGAAPKKSDNFIAVQYSGYMRLRKDDD